MNDTVTLRADLTTPGYKHLRAEYNVSGTGDAYGDAVGFMFALAEFLYHHDADLPASWQFSDAPGHTDADYGQADSYTDGILLEVFEHGAFELADALAFGIVLDRYLDILRAAGRDY